MKGLNKIALVTAISAASFGVNAELKSLDDSAMGELTGQAGVSIELSTEVAIAKFTYTDEGSFAVEDIKIGGSSQLITKGMVGLAVPGSADDTALSAGGAALDDLVINIDIVASGDAVISVDTISGAPIDFGISTGRMSLADNAATANTTLISSLSMDGLLYQLDITAVNGGGSKTDAAGNDLATLRIDTEFAIADLDVEVDFLAVGLEDVSVTGNGPHAGATLGMTLSAVDGAFTGGANTAAAGATSALHIALDNVYLNVDMPIVKVGGVSIGSIALTGLQLNNTTLDIYGH